MDTAMIITTNLSVGLMVMIAATTSMLIATSIVTIVQNVPLRITKSYKLVQLV
jgi:hypothetical protein